MNKVTEWYPDEIEPVRTGWYQCNICGCRHWWTGKNWWYGKDNSFRIAAVFKWRGLTRKPK